MNQSQQTKGWQLMPPAFSTQLRRRSPTPAATMKAAHCTAARIAVAVTNPAAPVRISPRPVIPPTIVAVSAAAVVAIAAASPVTIAGPVIAVVPRARANKDAAREPLRSVVSIRRTRIRVIGVVAISADGCGSDITRADSDSHRDLGL